MEKMIETAVIWALPLLLAITLHEAAHAYVARFLGDSTAYPGRAPDAGSAKAYRYAGNNHHSGGVVAGG